MAHKNWDQVKDIFNDALRRDAGERGAFLSNACGTDIDLRIEVESLLIAFDGGKSFLETPIVGEIPQPNSAWRLKDDQVISHYRIISPIASGAMGEVYLAEDEQLRRRVALKILPASLLENKERLHRFQREARVVSALNHPNILTIFEFATDNEIHFLASEFVQGETLRARLGNGRMTLHDTLEIAVQIASALRAAHDAGVVHRDIKPENVMIRDDGYVKVLDFGLAKLTQPATTDFDAETKQFLSQPGVIMGTVSYMSPEQARARATDARSDLFSFGVVLFEMLTGRVPFAGETTPDILAGIIQAEPRAASSYNGSVPDEMDRIIAKCLEKDRDIRYQTAADLLADLKRLFKRSEPNAEPIAKVPIATPLVGQPTEILTERSTDQSVNTPKTSRKRVFTAAVISTMVIAAVTFGYWYFNSQNTKQIESIAVMPFVNESGNADVEYLSDGMTDSLIISLSNLPNLSVRSRNSVFQYKGAEIDERKIGQDLNVQAVVLGRFTQRGDDITLYLSLIDSQTGSAIWGEQYDRRMRDLSALQKEITRDVSQKLRMRLSNADARNLTKDYSENAEAYQLYLKGRYFFNKRTPADFQKSRDYFQRAIDADPTYARAYSGLADFYGHSITNLGNLPPNETWPKHEALVRKALELDPDLAEAHNSLAGLKRNYYQDWAGAEQEIKRAIELDPNYAEAHVHYGSHLSMVGRIDEALAERKRAVELDPLSASINMRFAQTLYFMRRYTEAIEQLRKTIDLDPDNPIAHEWLGNIYEQTGMPDQAIAEWSTALTLSKNDELAEILKREFKKAGFKTAVRSVARKRLDLLNARMQRGDYIPAMRFARLYAQLGEREQTFSWLEKAAVEMSSPTVDILYDPLFDNLRDDPRFAEVIRRIGLPQ